MSMLKTFIVVLATVVRAGCAGSYYKVTDPGSGRTMEIWTTEPGVQLYTGNVLDGKVVGIGGKAYATHDALCLETQHFPDPINQHKFPTVLLEPGQSFTSTTIHKFSAK